MKSIQSVLAICLLWVLATGAAMGQGFLQSCSPNPILVPYSGSFTVTGTNTLWTRCTYGVSLVLTHSVSGQTITLVNPPGSMWHPGWGLDDDTLTAAVNFSGSTPTGFYDLDFVGYGMYGPNYFLHSDNFLSIGTLVSTDKAMGMPRISLSPNPAASRAVLHIDGAGPFPLTVELMDAHGRCLRSMEWGGGADLDLPLDLAGVAPGLYFVRVAAEGHVQTLRLQVVR